MLNRVLLGFLAFLSLWASGYVRADTLPGTYVIDSPANGGYYYNGSISGMCSASTGTFCSSVAQVCSQHAGKLSNQPGTCTASNETTKAYSVKDGLNNAFNFTAAFVAFSCSGGLVLQGSNCGHYSCPTNYTLTTGTSSCVSGQSTGCQAKAGTIWKTVSVDVGDWTAGGNPPGVLCDGSCASVENQSVAVCTKRLVNGVYHEVCGPIDYKYDGTVCTTPVDVVPAPTTDTCASGQSMGSANGQNICFNMATGAPVNPNQKCTTNKTTSKSTTNPDSSTSVTVTTTDCQGNSTTVTTTTFPDGHKTEQTDAQPAPGGTYSYPGGGGGAGGGTNAPPASGGGGGGGGGFGTASGKAPGASTDTPNISDICATNPNIPACKTPEPGTAAATTGLYTADGSGKSFSSSVSNFKTTVQGSALYSAATNFFSYSNAPGSCSGLNGNVSFLGHTTSIDLESTLCSSSAATAYSILAIGVMIAALYVAFRIAIL